ncbi:hypothetical protein BJ508DRAFT_308192 [Ascobolus immersus RN42]|uniref:Uncharacterized protein n=1 Tax=Ascobolus immersus RN42 TaxID=1160509 RepID=A0A3N4I0R8_ASCIM|nr:hypothetical protein BJ508DRAFT_308192 [Ascobolus immersus RN42]
MLRRSRRTNLKDNVLEKEYQKQVTINLKSQRQNDSQDRPKPPRTHRRRSMPKRQRFFHNLADGIISKRKKQQSPKESNQSVHLQCPSFQEVNAANAMHSAQEVEKQAAAPASPPTKPLP